MKTIKKFFNPHHNKTKRDYQARAVENKAEYSAISKKFDKDYWDADRKTGYGGYYDDGRWKETALQFIEEYNLRDGSNVLDIGCGKGFLLNEIKKINPKINIYGVDISDYAISCAPEEIRKNLQAGNASKLNYETDTFDLVFSINVLHNLHLKELVMALSEINRVSKRAAYICVESYRNEAEKWNLLRWQLTCEAFYSPESWEYVFKLSGYEGDYEFIYFE